jgi:hypothetical protein
LFYVNKISPNVLKRWIAASVFIFCAMQLNAQTDSTKLKIKSSDFSYFRIGIDASKIIASNMVKDYEALEFLIDANYKNNLVLSSEFGFGNSMVENEYLSYKSNNLFMRLGIDKTLFNKEFAGDMDNAFIGVRYGFGLVNRGQANYTVFNSIYGNSIGQIKEAQFLTHWLELTGGFKVEFKKNIFIGWHIRMKTFINPKKFEQLPPNYVAGYGRADKNTAFGYNFYLLYGIGNRK